LRSWGKRMKRAVSEATNRLHRLRFISGASMIPDPRKRSTQFPKGEDAYFIVNGRALGVADGVGAWSTRNVDAGMFSRELMLRASQYFEQDVSRIDPVQAMIFAEPYAKVHMGSCTFCTLAIEGHMLKSAVLGDSGFVVLRRDGADERDSGSRVSRPVRVCPSDGCLLHDRSKGGGWKVVYKSQEQQHAFNTPFQIGTQTNGVTSKNAISVAIPVRPGDLIVCGTDGLFDNLFLNDVCQLVNRYLETTNGFSNCIPGNVKQAAEAQKLAEFVTAAAVSASMHPGKRSPFSTQCVKAGYSAHGGKGDDITTIVAFVACESNSSSDGGSTSSTS
jgi:protein phosphatase PTC7